jgi:hypothetical protein
MADKKSSTAKPTTADKKPAQGKAKAKPKSATRELGDAELEKVSAGASGVRIVSSGSGNG